MVGDVGDVVVAQRHEERQQRLLGDLEGVAQVAVLERKTAIVSSSSILLLLLYS